MRFLLEAARKNSRRMRLEQLILLAVRTLILLLGGSGLRRAAGRGRLTASAAADALAPGDRDRRVVQHGSEDGRRDTIRPGQERRPADRGRLAARRRGEHFANRRAHVPPPSFASRPSSRTIVLPEIDRLQLTDEPGDLVPTLAEAVEILADPRAPQTKEVIFLSDFQRRHVGRRHLREIRRAGPVPQDRRQGQDRADRRRGRADGQHGHHLADRRRSRLCCPTGRPGSARPCAILDSAPLRGVRCELYADNYLVAFKPVDLPAREETVVEFPYEFRRSGEHAVEVRLPADRLAADNRRWLSVPVTDQIRVLVVNGHEGGRPVENASHYVRTVLAPSTVRESWSGATQPKVINEADLTAEDLSKFDCVFLCNVALVTRTEADLLQAYAEAGGGIVFALGDRVKPANYNAVLYRDGKGVLPAMLEGPIGNARDPVHGGYTVRRFRLEPSDRRSLPRQSGCGPRSGRHARIHAGETGGRIAVARGPQIQLRRSGDHRAAGRTRSQRVVDDLGRRLVEHVARPSDLSADDP